MLCCKRLSVLPVGKGAELCLIYIVGALAASRILYVQDDSWLDRNALGLIVPLFVIPGCSASRPLIICRKLVTQTQNAGPSTSVCYVAPQLSQLALWPYSRTRCPLPHCAPLNTPACN